MTPGRDVAPPRRGGGLTLADLAAIALLVFVGLLAFFCKRWS